jgi:hypothetical protein
MGSPQRPSRPNRDKFIGLQRRAAIASMPQRRIGIASMPQRRIGITSM